jgi:hypothetical protein
MKKLDFCENIFEQLVSPQGLILSSNRTALVASSGFLLERDHAAEIDTFDDVVRFNRSPTEYFEDIVGTKTTLRVVNNIAFNNNPIEPGWPSGDPNFVRSMRDSRILYFAPDYGPLANWKINVHPSNEVFYFQYDKVGEIRQMFNLSKNPTIGFGVVALCVLASIVPTLFGFDTEPGGPRTCYYGPRPTTPGPCHGVEEEKATLLTLAAQGKVVIR